MPEIVKVTSINPKELARLAKEFEEKLRILEKELNNYLSKYGFEISYHYELNIVKISNKDIEKIQKLTKRKPILIFPVLKTKPKKEIFDAFILENGSILLRNTVIEKSKLKEQYYILSRKGLQKYDG
ncbi:MAG: hypothetical protein DRO23_04100 [Thermoprotei archaeon]|nr:MAG: hypothetical protein DRO23_04100 [Thermoprotei archaeon]